MSTSPQEYSDKDKKDSKCKFQPTPDPKRVWGMTVFERIMAAFTGLGFFIAIGTLCILIQQWREMKLDQRAWITVEGFKLDHEPTAPGDSVGIVIAVTNTGKTPALSVINAENLTIGPPPESQKPDWASKKFGSPSMIFPNAVGRSYHADWTEACGEHVFGNELTLFSNCPDDNMSDDEQTNP
jgi:hypothetical protein